MAEEHKDAAMDAAQFKSSIEGIIKAIQVIAQKIDEIEGNHNALSKIVTEDLIGGIHNLYKANLRNGRIESLKTKYGESLGPHFSALGELNPDADLWGTLADSTGDMDDAALETHIKGLSDALGSKFAKIRGEHPGATEVKEVKVEGEPVSTEVKGEKEVASQEKPKEKEGEKEVASQQKDKEGKGDKEVKSEEKGKESKGDKEVAKEEKKGPSEEEIIAKKLASSKRFKF